MPEESHLLGNRQLAMPNSADSSGVFRLEYVSATRKAHGVHPLVDPAIDRMWVAIDDWYRTIDTATAKAVAEGFTHFQYSYMKSRQRIVLRLSLAFATAGRMRARLSPEARQEVRFPADEYFPGAAGARRRYRQIVIKEVFSFARTSCATVGGGLVPA